MKKFKKVLVLGLSCLTLSSIAMPLFANTHQVSAATSSSAFKYESPERIIETQYNTAQFVPEGYSIEEVLQNKNIIEPYFGKDYVMASEVKLHSRDCYPSCNHGAPYMEWWSSGWVSIIDKETHDDRYHYTNACVVSKQTGNTIFAESGRKYGYGKVSATSDDTHSNGEARIYWGW